VYLYPLFETHIQDEAHTLRKKFVAGQLLELGDSYCMEQTGHDSMEASCLHDDSEDFVGDLQNDSSHCSEEQTTSVSKIHITQIKTNITCFKTIIDIHFFHLRDINILLCSNHS